MTQEHIPFKGREIPTITPQPNIFFDIRKNIVLLFYAISVLLIGFTLLYVSISILELSSSLLIVSGVIFAILATLGGIFLSMFLDLPTIITDFDEIKNDIALGKISSPEVFSQRVVKLLCDFCNFPFFNIAHAIMKVEQEDCISSSSEFMASLDQDVLQSLLERSQKSADLAYIGKHEIGEESFHLYLVPIWFGNSWYGYFAVLTRQKLLSIFENFLPSFEDDHLDDQLIHVLNIQKNQRQKEFYKEINVFSNKIIKQEYGTLEEFKTDVLRLLTAKTSSSTGLFYSLYVKSPVIFGNENNQLAQVINHHFQAPLAIASDTDIYTEVGLEGKYIYRLPVYGEKLHGAIFLVADDAYCFKYFDQTLREIKDIKIDSDLENLAIQLGIKPVSEPPIIAKV